MDNTVLKLATIWESIPSLSEWREMNVPDPKLIYRDGISYQVGKYTAVALDLQLEEPRVSHYHTSKSVRLPVVMFKIPTGFVLSRDNFYDVKASFVLDQSPNYFLHEYMLAPYSEEKYEEEKQRCIEYREHSGNEDQYQTDEWLEDWSGAQIIRHDSDWWKARDIHSVYFEGINKMDLPKEVFTPYDVNKQLWSCQFCDISEDISGYDRLREAIGSTIDPRSHLTQQVNS